MTPYYEHAGITIYHGDCREVLPTLNPVDLVLTDPPYGYGWKTNYSRFTKGYHDKRAIAGDEPTDLSFLFSMDCEKMVFGFNCIDTPKPGSLLVWDKRGADGWSFLSDGEAAYWSTGVGVYIFSKNGQQARSEAGLHPTQKPLSLMRWCIELAKTEGTILDPFMGSGTTLRAAKDLGRKAIGIEIEERYCEIAARRLGQEVFVFDGVA
jgi:DNA modification methylase